TPIAESPAVVASNKPGAGAWLGIAVGMLLMAGTAGGAVLWYQWNDRSDQEPLSGSTTASSVEQPADPVAADPTAQLSAPTNESMVPSTTAAPDAGGDAGADDATDTAASVTTTTTPTAPPKRSAPQPRPRPVSSPKPKP